MAVSIGIVGLPNVGKSTLFNVLTKQSVPAENFPFCTIDPSVGVVPVPDRRLDRLANIFTPERVVPATVTFVDIAGLVQGASTGEGLGNNFLSHIREVDAVVHVVRCFLDDSVTHVGGAVDPVQDIEVVETELLLADVQLVERRIGKIDKEVQQRNSDAATEKALLEEVVGVLRQGRMASSLSLSADQRKYLHGIGLLTVKPVMYVCNIGTHYDERSVDVVRACAKRTGSVVVTVSVLSERDLSVSDCERDTVRHEQPEEGVGGGEGVGSVIRSAYQVLGRISFFTAGEREVRAWTIPEGFTAPQAGGVIHSDFEKRFIRVQVISFDSLVRAGSYASARNTGDLRTEGKDYLVQDGDVVEFMHG